MTIAELKELLEEYPDELEVRIAVQQHYPFESRVAGVIAPVRDELDVEEGDLDATTDDCVYILEGSQIGYARRGLWSQT